MLIKMLLIPGLFILSCGPTKSGGMGEKNDSVMVVNAGKDTSVAGDFKNDPAGIPPCIQKKIDSFKVAEKHAQPQKVVEYRYKGKKVYYVEMPCCDFFNEVYDDKCNLLGSPDGGFTGKGDGRLPDFHETATNEKLIWKAVQ